MSLFVKLKFVDRKMRVPSSTDEEKQKLAEMRQFAVDNDGKDFFMQLFSADEINFNRAPVNYYYKIMLPSLYLKLKDEYGLESQAEADAVIHVMFSKKERFRTVEGEKKPYNIIVNIRDLTFAEQGVFITKVADLAITKYQIRFPSPNEINQAQK